ncbi:MAG: hypothetical protein LBN00_10040, partial [Oscillospiraceae bacterium]|nr:hypothetical protein [Oscillospiraceae bacterium]
MALIDIARASAKSLQKKIDAQNSTKTGATVTPAPAMRPTIAPASGRARSAGARAVTLTKQDGTTEGSTLGAFMVERGNAERAKKAAEEKERNEAIAYSQYLQNEAAKVSPKLAPSGYPSGWSELAKRTKEDAKDLSKTVPLSIASSGADIIKGAGDLIASIPLQTTNQAVNAMYGYTPAWVDPAVPTNLDMLKVQMTPQLEAAMRAEVDPENKSGATTRELLIDREVADTGATDPLKKWHEFTAPLNTPRKLREEIYARQQARGLLPIEQKLLSGIDSAAENAIPIALGGGLGTDLVFGLQVLGQSVENALAAGADYDTALANGVMSAVAEVGIEKLSGGLGSINKIGAVQIAGDAMKARLPAAVAEFLAKMPKSLTKFIAFAGDIGGEGLEEFAGAFIEPYITRATINPNASNATLDEAIDAGIIGMVSALFISGAQLAADGIMTAAEKNAAKKEAERVRAEINNYIGEYNKRPENRRAPLPAVAEQTRGTSRTPSPTAEAVQTPASAEAPPLERGQGDSLAIENNHTPE